MTLRSWGVYTNDCAGAQVGIYLLLAFWTWLHHGGCGAGCQPMYVPLLGCQSRYLMSRLVIGQAFGCPD